MVFAPINAFTEEIVWCVAWNCRLHWASPREAKVPLSGVELDVNFLSEDHREPGRVRDLKAGVSEWEGVLAPH